MKTNKKIQTAVIILLSVCCALPLARLSTPNNLKNQQSLHSHTRTVTYKKNIKHSRRVTKFKTAYQSSQLNSFNKLKQEFTNTNITAITSNTSKFNMNIKYSGFNSFGIKVKHVVKSVGGDLKQPNLNIGVSQFPKMQVQVPGHSSAWKDYVSDLNEDKIPDATKISESSITYQLIVTGSTDYETATFVMSYALRNRKSMDKTKDVQLGHFDVYNRNNNAKKGLSDVSTGIIIGVFVSLLFALYSIGQIGAIRIYLKRGFIRKYFTEQFGLRTIAPSSLESSFASQVGDETSRYLVSNYQAENSINVLSQSRVEIADRSGVNVSLAHRGESKLLDDTQVRRVDDVGKSTSADSISQKHFSQERIKMYERIDEIHQDIRQNYDGGTHLGSLKPALEDRINFTTEIFHDPTNSDAWFKSVFVSQKDEWSYMTKLLHDTPDWKLEIKKFLSFTS